MNFIQSPSHLDKIWQRIWRKPVAEDIYSNLMSDDKFRESLGVLYLGAKIHFYPYFPHLLPDFG